MLRRHRCCANDIRSNFQITVLTKLCQMQHLTGFQSEMFIIFMDPVTMLVFFNIENKAKSLSLFPIQYHVLFESE